MLEDAGSTMEKKPFHRQSSTSSKSGPIADGKKNEKYSKQYPRRAPRENREYGIQQPASDRKPAPQKFKSAGDKRPPSRRNPGYRQREEVVDYVSGEVGSSQDYGSKKSLTHLLNFTYGDRGGHGRGGSSTHHPQRRYRSGCKIKYSKEQFLQANCQFVVRDTGDYTVHAADPDRPVKWDFVEEVRTVSHELPTCPICLQLPFAAKITQCGHIYCWACILHYLSLVDKQSQTCPICYNFLKAADLRSVQTEVKSQFRVGDTITMRLMKRERGSTFAVPVKQWEGREGRPLRMTDAVNTEYVKVLVASTDEILETVVARERAALAEQLKNAEDSEICFIETAMNLLNEREENLRTGAEVKALLEGKESDSRKNSQSSDGGQDTPKAPIFVPKWAQERPKVVRYYTSAFSDDEFELESNDPEEDEESLSEGEEEGLSESTSTLGSLETEDWMEGAGAISNSSSPALSDQALGAHSAHSLASASPPVEGQPIGEAPCPKAPTEASIASSLESGSSVPESPVPEMMLVPKLPAGETETLVAAAGGAQQRETPSGHTSNITKDHFYFYQAEDGQSIFLQSVNARCLMSQYGGLAKCPETITASIVELDSFFMTEEIRKRHRYLGHLPLTCECKFAELVLKPPLVSRKTLQMFSEELEKRKKQRQRRAKDDKRRSKKIAVEENKKMGLYPEMKISLSNVNQFPVCGPGRSGGWTEDYSLQFPVSPPSGSPPGLNVAARPFVPGVAVTSPVTSPREEEPSSSTFSFAKALKEGKQVAPPVKPTVTDQGESSKVASRPGPRVDSEESDNEDRVPVPEYHQSFSSALAAALDSHSKAKEIAPAPGKGGGKKKQKAKQVLLFNTSMARGKGDAK